MSGQKEQKAALRSQLADLRVAHGPLDAAAAAVSTRLLALAALRDRRVILGYAATPREIGIDAALEAWLGMGRTVCLPWVDGPHLGVAAVADLAGGLAPGWRGVREPQTPRQVLPPDQLDALVIPGLGFDLSGNRLGYGGGHFDRLLAAVRTDAVIVGVALDAQVVDRVPVEAHDRRVDLVVTPTRTLTCRTR